MAFMVSSRAFFMLPFMSKKTKRSDSKIHGPLVAILLVAASLAACQSPQGALPPTTQPVAVQPKPVVSYASGPLTESVIVVAIDGVRWQEVFEGVERSMAEAEAIPEAFILPPHRLLPNLHGRVFARGVVLGAPGKGPEMRASGPNHISLPGYMEIFGGAPSSDCSSNECPATRRKTVVDAFRDAYAPQGGSVGVISSWEKIERAAVTDPTGVALSTGRTGGATRESLRSDPVLSELLDVAADVGPHPGHGDYRPDYYTAAVALRYLWARRPRFLFVGLGDTDEWAHMDNYEAYLQSLRFADTFVGSVLDTLEMMGSYGARTTLIVTTDHGRSRDFVGHGKSVESGRVWMAAVGGRVPALGAVESGGERRLADIAPTVMTLVGLPPKIGSGAVLAEVIHPAEKHPATALVGGPGAGRALFASPQ